MINVNCESSNVMQPKNRFSEVIFRSIYDFPTVYYEVTT